MAGQVDSKALYVLLAFQEDIRVFVDVSDLCNLARSSRWLRNSIPTRPRSVTTTSFLSDEELHDLAQRLRARLIDGSRSSGRKSRKKNQIRLTTSQICLLLRDLLLVASGLRASCLVDCCALTRELAELLLQSLDIEIESHKTHPYAVEQLRAVLLDGNVFFINVEAFVREKMLTLANESRQQLYIDVNAVAGDDELDGWSEQENCLAMNPLSVVQTSLQCENVRIILQEFSVPQQLNVQEKVVNLLTGDAVEDEEQRFVAKKQGLLSSKLLRGLFGDVTMQCIKDVPGDSISKEAFICILALCYEGNTEDRISYIFTMYNITLTGENNNEEGHIAEKDFLYLLNYLEEYMPLPKQLYAAFEECAIPMAGLLSNSQFVAWVRQYPDVMEFLAVHLPPSQLPVNPLTIRTNEELLANR
ncbi:hypothetical protein BBJ29_000435 [Phytophthora kernoviae]|uniref:Uncharacterized protein n=1 Tax=Phytophthora kernoviae TaxID=325452 RepID=A0A3F2RT96_9STRA|nr:hypothetical protein BBJ29_000435 [Phytophthora kernoviae]RLN63325.1 hypothetical protein BBP00_00004248 [Phytophthora kernoviae]